MESRGVKESVQVPEQKWLSSEEMRALSEEDLQAYFEKLPDMVSRWILAHRSYRARVEKSKEQPPVVVLAYESRVLNKKGEEKAPVSDDHDNDRNGKGPQEGEQKQRLQPEDRRRRGRYRRRRPMVFGEGWDKNGSGGQHGTSGNFLDGGRQPGCKRGGLDNEGNKQCDCEDAEKESQGHAGGN